MMKSKVIHRLLSCGIAILAVSGVFVGPQSVFAGQHEDEVFEKWSPVIDNLSQEQVDEFASAIYGMEDDILKLLMIEALCKSKSEVKIDSILKVFPNIEELSDYWAIYDKITFAQRIYGEIIDNRQSPDDRKKAGSKLIELIKLADSKTKGFGKHPIEGSL